MKKKRIYFFRRSFWQTKLINFFADNLNVSIELDNGFIYEGELKKKRWCLQNRNKGPVRQSDSTFKVPVHHFLSINLKIFLIA